MVLVRQLTKEVCLGLVSRNEAAVSVPEFVISNSANGIKVCIWTTNTHWIDSSSNSASEDNERLTTTGSHVRIYLQTMHLYKVISMNLDWCSTSGPMALQACLTFMTLVTTVLIGCCLIRLSPICIPPFHAICV